MMRYKGDIRRVDMRPLTQEDMERLLLPGLSPKHRKTLDEEGGVDFSYVIGQDECRFRVSLFKQRGRLSLVSRRVNTNIPSFEKLGLDCIDWHKALKDAVRQDPDVILVGELRDVETVEAAVPAAELGYPVFG